MYFILAVYLIWRLSIFQKVHATEDLREYKGWTPPKLDSAGLRPSLSLGIPTRLPCNAAGLGVF